MSRPGRWLAVLVAVLALSTCGGNEPLGEFVPEPMAWGSCGDLLVSIDGELECGWLEVPVDHADPGGGTIDIPVARWNSRLNAAASLYPQASATACEPCRVTSSRVLARSTRSPCRYSSGVMPLTCRKCRSKVRSLTAAAWATSASRYGASTLACSQRMAR